MWKKAKAPAASGYQDAVIIRCPTGIEGLGFIAAQSERLCGFHEWADFRLGRSDRSGGEGQGREDQGGNGREGSRKEPWQKGPPEGQWALSTFAIMVVGGSYGNSTAPVVCCPEAAPPANSGGRMRIAEGTPPEERGATEERLRNPLTALFVAPIFRRLGFHAKRIGGQLDRHFFTSLLTAVVAFVLIASLLVTLVEPEKLTMAGFGSSFYWAITTVIGSGDASYVSSPGGFVIGWLLAFFGVAIVAAMTGAVVGFFIDFLLKEGQGMGAAGYRDHIVVCGWNATARDLIEELKGDEFTTKVVLLHEAERNPAGDGVYFVRGDITNTDDLERCGIREASSAIVFPTDRSDEADMRSILAVMAIESIAPAVRTVVEANNPAHLGHFRRADADEILVTSRLASRLLARSALYPGLSELVTDIVSGGTGSELYRVVLPDAYIGLTIDELSAKLRGEHRATLLAVTRDGTSMTNPSADFRLQPGDDAVVVAESLGELRPLELQQA